LRQNHCSNHMDGTGAYSFTPAWVLAERRRQAQENEEWKEYFDGRTPEVITWDEWDDLSLWWTVNKTYYILPSVRMIDSCSIQRLGDWKMPFRIIFRKLDFRDLLRLLRVSKSFQQLVLLEIDRRRADVSAGDFYSTIYNWHLGKRCESQDFTRRSKMCGRWEEILTLGEHNMCRECLRSRDRPVRDPTGKNRNSWFDFF
jgi:hypothetical protein